MADSPTIVVARLDDKELQESIKSMVASFNKGLNDMKTHADSVVKSINESLKGIKGGSASSGGVSDGGSAKRAKAQETEAKAVANTAMTYDNLQSTISKVTQSSEKYTDEIRKQAQAIRDSKEWQEKGRYTFADGTTIYNLENEKKGRVAVEQQILDYQYKQAQAAGEVATAEDRVSQAAMRTAMAMFDVNEAASKSHKILSGKSGTVSMFQRYDDLRASVASVLNVEQSRIKIADVETASTKQLSASLKQLQEAYANLSAADRNSDQGKTLILNMQQIEREIQRVRTQASRPISWEAIDKLPTNTLDDIAYKLRQLQAYKGGLNFDTHAAEIRKVNENIDSLRRAQLKYMSDAQKLTGINEALGRSWTYMKNRLAFYFTVGASTQFVKNLIEVRSQYEMNERALGILIDSAERGTKIFNELSQMALVSPYTLIELSSAAKQLTAYDVAAKDVVDTTRRLADMAAAVGVPIERLTYALGQIKAYGYLNSRDNRMFANAGIPLVKQLSDYYTELEGRLVSTADVYDRIKKKQVGYEEVMSVIAQMTDQGGKFYDFQAKMAETMKVQLANLTLAWNNMLNDIGGESQGMLVGGIQALRQLFLHWKDVEHVLKEVAVAYGAFKAYQLVTTKLVGASANALDAHILSLKREQATMLQKEALTRKLTASEANLIATQKTLTATDYQNALSSKSLTKQQAMLLVAMNMKNKSLQAAIIRMGLLTRQEIANLTVGKALSVAFAMMGISIKNAAMAMKSFLVSNWWMVLLGGVYELYHAWDSYEEHVAEVNKNAAEHAKEAFENIKQYLESDVISQLRNKVVMTPQGVSDTDGAKAWDEMREKIELSSQASNTFIARLMSIDDINHRLAAGFDYLRDVERVAGVMKTMSDDAITVSSTSLGGILGEGLKDDLNDFINAYEKYISLNENLRQGSVGEYFFNDQKRALEEFRGEIEKTTTSLYNIASKEGFNTNEQREFFERAISEIAQAEQMGAKETRIFRMQAEKEYYAYARAQLVAQLEYQQGAQRAATEQRIRELDNEFGTHKDMQQAFFEWVNEKHAHEVRKRFGNMTKEEIAHIDWSQQKWKQWAEKLSKDFSHEYGVSFNELQKLVLQANTWSIHIPVFFQTIGQPLTDIQRDYEARTGKKFSDNPLIKDAKSQLEIIDTLKKRQAELAKEIDAAEKAGGEYWENNKERMQAENTALIADIHAYNALTEAEEKAQNKSGKGGSKKDPVLDALKTEIKLVEQLQGEYDKLTKSSASREDALATIRGAFGNTIKQLNSQLRGYGLPELTTELITGKDPNKALAHFKQTLQSLVDKGMMSLERSKEVEAVIEKLTISAKIYNLDKITKGLNSELDKLKEEYELAVELDANPELGSLFADWWDIDMEGLPHTAQAYAERATKLVNQYLKDENAGLELPLLTKITNDDLRSLREAVDADQFNAAWLEIIEKAVKASRDVRQKEASDQKTDWDNLLQKYAEYEYKKTQIAKTAEEERRTLVERFGTDEQKERFAKIKTELDTEQDPEKKDVLKSQLIELVDSIASSNDTALQIKTSIDTKELRDYANLDFTEFQKTGTWVVATGDLAGMTNTALRGLIRSLEEYKAKAKNLDPKQIKQINRALKSLHSELRKNNPFGAMADAMEEARLRSNELDVDIQQTEAQIDRLIEKREKNGKLTEEEEKELEDYRKQLNGLNKEQDALADVSLQTMVTEVTKVTSALSGATSMVGELAEAFGDTATAEVVKDVGTVLDKIGQGASIGSIGGGWGALAGAIVGLGAGLAQIFAGSGNKKITEVVEDSENAVKRLESQYKSLEYAVGQSYGVAQVGALKAAKANKDLQLMELKRQLMLEEQRESKHRDEEKIESLKGQIMELQNEINDMVEDFVNDMMGISSVSDAMENVVSAMIEAFKKGEDYMKEYDDSFAEMIDNMIAKSIASTLVGDTIKDVAAKVKEAAYTRTNRNENERRFEEINALIPQLESELADMTGDIAERQREWIDRLNEYNEHRGRMNWEEVQHAYDHYMAGQNAFYAKRAVLTNLQIEQQNIKELLDKEVVMTPEDVNSVRKAASDARSQVQKQFQALMDAYGITFGQDAEGAKLSNLQQGISQISEQTANSIEAYLNGVSQQVYLHSTLLTQIRDVMVAFDPEVSMGIQSQMLLQMQTQYQLMESMHSLMSSWTNPAGNGIRVEML